MPSFTTQNPNLLAIGPVVDIQLGVSRMAQTAFSRANISVPLPLRVQAMIDTGATRTVVSEGLAQQLGLQPVSVTHIHTPSSNDVRCYEYFLSVILPNNISIDVVSIEAPLKNQHIQCLIGRDILALGVLVYIGYTNTFSFSI